MAAVARYLVDTSALARQRLPQVAEVLDPLIEDGVVATCGAIEFEVLWSTRSPTQFGQTRDDRNDAFEWLPTGDEEWQRALDVQGELWATGYMRTVPLPDLLIAAVAERHQVTVLHYDTDYDLIAEVTEQPMLWVVKQGSLDSPPAT